jgi:uncharacterized protein (UPF0333 family)
MTVGSILYAFKSSDALQVLMLVILGLVVTSSALIYVLIVNFKNIPKAHTNTDTLPAARSVIMADIMESIAYLFFM